MGRVSAADKVTWNWHELGIRLGDLATRKQHRNSPKGLCVPNLRDQGTVPVAVHLSESTLHNSSLISGAGEMRKVFVFVISSIRDLDLMSVVYQLIVISSNKQQPRMTPVPVLSLLLFILLSCHVLPCLAIES